MLMWRVKKRRVLVCIGIVCFVGFVYLVRLDRIDKESEEHSFSNLTFDPLNYISNEKITVRDVFAKHAFNFKASNDVPIGRNVPDSRHPQCKSKRYVLSYEHSVSVIIAFHNEARSALLRTIYSILLRTPEILLKDIILIDDYSRDESDGIELANFPKIKLIRNSRREGLIRSRMIGLAEAEGSHIMFIDSHCEVNAFWLEPLLQALTKNTKALASPIIDIIDTNTFEYKPSSGQLKGGFDWSLTFRWHISTKNETQSDPTKVFKSPVIPGGLFLVKKSWFEEIGGFDKGLDIWGTENIEISLKSWLCGGEVVTVPCSRIGHVFRKKHPYSFPPNGSLATYLKNSRRIAEVWLDEYKNHFYELKPQAKTQLPEGLEAMIQLKKKLKCKPFQWYLDNVYPELKPLSKDAVALGQLQQEGMCLQGHASANNKSVMLTECLPTRHDQEWYLSKSGELHQDHRCLSAVNIPNKPKIYLAMCSNSIKQKWTRRRRLLIHHVSGLCLENAMNAFLGISYLTLSPCRRKSFSQQWDFSMELQAWGDR